MKKPNKGGRPPTVINWDEFDKLCLIQATLREIASWFSCSEDTIENKCKSEKRMGFSEYYAQKAGKGKVSLRRKQYELAMQGDKTMLIWLGKQYLEQSEKVEQRNETVTSFKIGWADELDGSNATSSDSTSEKNSGKPSKV